MPFYGFRERKGNIALAKRLGESVSEPNAEGFRAKQAFSWV